MRPCPFRNPGPGNFFEAPEAEHVARCRACGEPISHISELAPLLGQPNAYVLDETPDLDANEIRRLSPTNALYSSPKSVPTLSFSR